MFAHGFLLVGGEKMSKTALNQIAPADLVADFGCDGFRYHLLADLRFGPDGDFSYEAMVARYNADLANNFGNLASRVLNMAVNYVGGVSPDTRADGPLVDAARRAFDGLSDALDQLDFATGFGAVWELIRATNAYIEDREPWKLHKAGDTAATAAVLGDCLEALRIVALLASPVIPRAAAELWRRLGLPGDPNDQRLPAAAEWGLLPAGIPLEKGASLFPRIDPPSDPRPAETGEAVIWVDSHCHLQMAAGRGGRDARSGPGRGGRRVGVRRDRPRVVASGGRARRAPPRRGRDGRPAPARRVAPRRRVADLEQLAVRPGSWPWARPASTSTTSTRRSTRRTRRSGPRSGSPTGSTGRS